jgi:hypothetical protein
MNTNGHELLFNEECTVALFRQGCALGFRGTCSIEIKATVWIRLQ